MEQALAVRAAQFAHNFRRFVGDAGGHLVDYVAFDEAIALAALCWEANEPDIVLVAFMSYFLEFDWDGWSAEFPAPEPVPSKRPPWVIARAALGTRGRQADVLPLDGFQLSDVHAAWFARALVTRHQLAIVDLSFNSFGCEGLTFLLAALRYSSVDVLSLCSTKIGDAGAALVADLLAAPTCAIRVLNLSNNMLTGAGACNVVAAAARAGGRTEQISLTNNDAIDDGDALAMVELLRGVELGMLLRIDLRGCSCSSCSVEELRTGTVGGETRGAAPGAHGRGLYGLLLPGAFAL